MSTITISDFDFASAGLISDLRNGKLEDITEILPRVAIAPERRWILVADLPEKLLEARLPEIACAYGALIIASNPGLNEVAARQQGIVLAAIRLGMWKSFALSQTDLSPGETRTNLVRYIAPTAPAPDPAATSSASTTIGTGKKKDAKADKGTFQYTWKDSKRTAGEAFVGKWGPLTNEEITAAQHLVGLASAILMLQGVSLVKCGHHFLSAPGQSMRKPWDGLLKQFRSKVQSVVWPGLDAPWFEDLAFHAAGHPILMSMKKDFAQNPDMKERIKRAGWGVVAIRLPATEPDFEVVKAVIALFERVGPTMTAMGGTVNVAGLVEARLQVEQETDSKQRSAYVARSVGAVHSREPAIGYAIGIMEAMLLVSVGGTNTILAARSITKIKNDQPATVAEGSSDYRAYMASRRDARDRGRIEAMSVDFGERNVIFGTA